ncbi:MAG: hypothetical protein CL917_02035 [Deltaproteobacteria bacterium]|nr:hypothetical protein [Deltaproteobacteria bacterium]
MVFFDYAFAAIPMLGILVFVHEFGHFIVAKLCGVRVLRFSLGFGSPIGFGNHRLRWERGGTEYVVAWVPLGGFVRMLGQSIPGEGGGEDPEPVDVRPDEYLESKPVWQKIAITVAGPLMNLVLPVLIFMVMLWVGIPKVTSVVGMVERESPAAEVGLRPGDEIVAIDGEPVRWWSEVDRQIREHQGEEVELTVLRGDESLEIEVPRGARSALDEFGDAESIGWVGLGSQRLPALVGIPQADSLAGQSGLRSGDRVIEVQGESVEDWEDFLSAYEGSQGQTYVDLTVESGKEDELEQRSVRVPVVEALDQLGVISATVLVGEVVAGMPAEAAGLAPGDLILEVNGRSAGSFRNFADTVRSSGGRSLEIVYAREGEVIRTSIAPVVREVAGPFEIDGMESEIYQVGIAHAMATLPGHLGVDRERNPLVALPRAIAMTADNVGLLLQGLGKLVTGQVGTDQLRGPITIVQIARKSLDIGWQAYLGMMIFISINLAIVNLLPIPILDGGQLMIYVIEGIKRSPLSLRTREWVYQFGFILIVMMMGLAFWNDLSGQWAKFVTWLGLEL